MLGKLLDAIIAKLRVYIRFHIAMISLGVVESSPYGSYFIGFICLLCSDQPYARLYSFTDFRGTYIITSEILASQNIGGIVARHMMLDRFSQFVNVEAWRLVTLLGIVMLVILLQPSNAQCPISVTLFGMVMVVRLRQ